MITWGNPPTLRAKEDYLMGINFSRLLTLRYGNSVSSYLGSKYQAISVGRVMTCVLGHGGAPGAGDPGICENSLLPGAGKILAGGTSL